jgi:predicted DNA-binding transcriptional regulator YafY
MLIDQELRAERLPNAVRLARSLEVNPRTIGRDIEYMRDQLGAPIEFDAVRNGYFYRDPTYRLPYFQLSQGELLALYLAERMMHPLRGTPFEADLRRAITKLDTMLPDGVSIRLDALADFLSVLPASQPHYDPDSFCALTRAVACSRRLEMVYWTAARNATSQREFDPYDLALIEDGWYAVGYCHLRLDVRMFAIQRVKLVRETGEVFTRPPDFRLDEYLKGSFRAVRGDGDHDIVLRFAPDLAPRIAERTWHPSQTLDECADGSLIVRFHVNDLREVKRWVLSWGAGCQVLEPEELRESIMTELNRMLDNAARAARKRPSNTRTGTKPPGRRRAALEGA